MTEDEMAGWHYGLDGHEFKQTPGGSGGLRSLAGHRVEKNWTQLSD